MDVDEVQVELEVTPTPDEQAQHALAAQFFPFPFTHEKRDAILARRSVMSDELVFDLLLEQASILSPQSLYPPSSPDSLLHLLDAISHCPWDTLKKACLQFYLLSHVSTDVAAQHAAACALPPQFVHLARACFLLDSGSSEDMARAVTLFSDARIVQDLSPKVLHTLSLAPQPDSSRLVRRYVRAARPVLEEYEDLAIYVRALIEYSLADAWSFQRTFSETTSIRNQLIRTILDSCLIPPKPSVLPHLLALPLTSYEFSLLQSYAIAPPGELSSAAQAILQNLITVRLLHSGKYSEVVCTSRAFDKYNATSHSNVAPPLRKAAEERQQMIRDVLTVVPEVQRRQLELELSEGRGNLATSSLSESWVNAENDISMSWESLGASSTVRSRPKVVGPTRSGTLEGSPAPGVLERSSNGALFEPLHPLGSAQKRKVSANPSFNIFGTPAKEAQTRAPIFPQIPISALGVHASSGTSSPLANSGFRPIQHLGSTPLSHLTHVLQGEISPALRLGPGPQARHTLYRPEPSKTTSSLIARQHQGKTGVQYSTPVKRNASGEAKSRGTHIEKASKKGDPKVDEQDSLGEPEDIVMLDSDDPDGFVVRGRRRPPIYPSGKTGELDDRADVEQDGRSGATSLFTRDASLIQKSDARPHEHDRVLPGGFASSELISDSQGSPPSNHTTPGSASVLSKETQFGRTHTHTTHHDVQFPLQTPVSQLKIPGGFFEEDAEVEEEQDHVSSLPPVPMKGGRRKRTSRASSVVTDSSEDDQSRAPLRRSSRLSSTGLSLESPSPKKSGKKAVTKKRAKNTAGSTARRKRKETED